MTTSDNEAGSRSPYTGTDNLEVMREAKNYNRYLLNTVRKHLGRTMGALVRGEFDGHRPHMPRSRTEDGRAVAELPSINGYRLQFVLTNLAAQ